MKNWQRVIKTIVEFFGYKVAFYYKYSQHGPKKIVLEFWRDSGSDNSLKLSKKRQTNKSII